LIKFFLLRKEKSCQSGKGLGAPPRQLSTSSYRAHSVTVMYNEYDIYNDF